MSVNVGTLAVNLVAITKPFMRGLARVRKRLKKFRARMLNVGRAVGQLGSALTRVATVGLVALAAGFAKTIAAGEKFNRAMTSSLAIMGDLSGFMRGEMRKAALDVSATTRFSASQAAESYFFLASAGLDAKQSIAALPQVAKFAQAGMFDMALATDLATDAQSALGLVVGDAQKNLTNLTRVTDTLVKANTLANASVQQFSEALTNKAGASLRFLNKDVEEGVAVLAAFADQGLKGADAGTAFSIVLRELGNKSIINSRQFKELGISVFDSSGKMKNMADVIGSLENALKGMSSEQKLATLLQAGFNQKSIDSIKVLLGTSEKIRGYEKALRAAGGTTEEIAKKQMTAMEVAINKITSGFERFATSPFVRQLTVGVVVILTQIGDKLSGIGSSLGNSRSAAITFTTVIAGGIGLVLDVLHTLNLAWLKLRSLFVRGLQKIFEGFVFLKKAIESVVEFLGLPIDKSGTILDGMADAIRASADELNKEFNKAFLKAPPSAAIKKWTDDLTKKMKDATPIFTPILEGAIGNLISGIKGGLGRLRGLFPQGAVSPVATAVSGGPGGRNSAGAALLRGSSEAFSATRFSKRGDDPIKKVEKNTKKQLDKSDDTNTLLAQIAGFLRPSPPADLIPGAG